jgi:hypothetical protein
MLVGPADHQHVAALEAVVAGKDVGRDAEADDVTEVPRPGGIRPRGCDEDSFSCS